MSHSLPNSTFPSVSAADFLPEEELEEAEFLRTLKGTVREWLATLGDMAPSQAKLADMAGIDPAQLSRALSPDSHVSTRTLFRVAYALRCRWNFTLTAVGTDDAAVPRKTQSAYSLLVGDRNASTNAQMVSGGTEPGLAAHVNVRVGGSARASQVSLVPA